MDPRGTTPAGALPTLVIIGAMKCGTTSLHRYLDLHPEVAMSGHKELNFFFGPVDGEPDPMRGNWARGVDWYAARFDPAAAVRGEASPGYTSPDHPEVAGRMASVVPDARLVYAVRDPVDRAVSQYWHHRREGTEARGPEEALLDPRSQYVARGRYLERLAPFLSAGFADRVAVVAQEDLRDRPRATMRRLFAWLGVDEGHWSPGMAERRNSAPEPARPLSAAVRDGLRDAVRDDADRLREFTGQAFPQWSV
ncbi:sulfotransferase family protein [Blastococcus tunisiensis]|uniref:Sulfotransferase family protein n=1 Tax=Blastococcus tunisiensis TaxID=1798228 RepID=A0A1I2MPN0_9ACTN|nr:sulfotransferase [Blastococcus sp. DSM 46838]SFF93068.1 Sulfotransferase family protein [Blastococcus sp. DSM 46838]